MSWILGGTDAEGVFLSVTASLLTFFKSPFFFFSSIFLTRSKRFLGFFSIVLLRLSVAGISEFRVTAENTKFFHGGRTYCGLNITLIPQPMKGQLPIVLQSLSKENYILP